MLDNIPWALFEEKIVVKRPEITLRKQRKSTRTNQWRNNDGYSLSNNSGKLKAQRFATAWEDACRSIRGESLQELPSQRRTCRHHNQAIISADKRQHNVFLLREEARVEMKTRAAKRTDALMILKEVNTPVQAENRDGRTQKEQLEVFPRIGCEPPPAQARFHSKCGSQLNSEHEVKSANERRNSTFLRGCRSASPVKERDIIILIHNSIYKLKFGRNSIGYWQIRGYGLSTSPLLGTSNRASQVQQQL